MLTNLYCPEHRGLAGSEELLSGFYSNPGSCIYERDCSSGYVRDLAKDYRVQPDCTEHISKKKKKNLPVASTAS